MNPYLLFAIFVSVLAGIDLALIVLVILQHFDVIGPVAVPGT